MFIAATGTHIYHFHNYFLDLAIRKTTLSWQNETIYEQFQQLAQS